MGELLSSVWPGIIGAVATACLIRVTIVGAHRPARIDRKRFRVQ